MKILYAAQNTSNAAIQLSRILNAMQGGKHQIKVAAYKRSSPKNINIDWTLDALLDIYRPDTIFLNNDNLGIYFDQVKSFAPDLVISDLEYFTSFVANQLNVPLWQCSSSLLNFAMTYQCRYSMGINKYYGNLFDAEQNITRRTSNIIDNSDRNLIYSHYGDSEAPPTLKAGFEWLRPYHRVHEEHVPCRHYAVAVLTKSNKSIIDVLKKHPDSVIFMRRCAERYPNVFVKDIANEDEYYCNLKNSPLFICQGQSSFLADAFYNGKFPLIYPDFSDIDAIINSQITKVLKLGANLIHTDDISLYVNRTIQPAYNQNIKMLHQEI